MEMETVEMAARRTRSRWSRMPALARTSVIVGVLAILGLAFVSTALFEPDDDQANHHPIGDSFRFSDTNTQISSPDRWDTFVVGVDIEPGVYEVSGCWAIVNHDLEIIDHDLQDSKQLIVVTESDYGIAALPGMLEPRDQKVDITISPGGRGDP